ncbi:hypothetical protein H4217_002615 [Coemansia sp. RSA 1939]|nr:hypothetical protein H4217_002615 [Coemansia sp. RSA 1939]
MVAAHSVYTCKPNKRVCLAAKNASGAFPTRYFIHADSDIPSAGAESSTAILDVSASADHHSSQEQQHRQASGDSQISQLSPEYVLQAIAKLEWEHAINNRSKSQGKSFVEKLICLEEGIYCLGDDIDNLHAERLVLIADLKQLKEENQALKERCAMLEEKAANPPACTLPHGLSDQERGMIEHLEDNMLQLETDLEQAQVERSVLEANLEQLQEHDLPQLLKENDDLKDERDSLEFELDNAQAEIRMLTDAAPTPASSPDIEGDDGIEDADSQDAEIMELRVDCDDSQQRITTLEKQVYMLVEELEQTCDQANRASQDMLCPHEQKAAVALTTVKLDHGKTCPQNKINSASIGLATPTSSGAFKNLFHSNLSNSESLRLEVMTSPLAPPTSPPVRHWYSMGDALIHPRADTAAAQVAPKTAPATTRATAAKAAKAIRKAAARAMAHFHHH